MNSSNQDKLIWIIIYLIQNDIDLIDSKRLVEKLLSFANLDIIKYDIYIQKNFDFRCCTLSFCCNTKIKDKLVHWFYDTEKNDYVDISKKNHDDVKKKIINVNSKDYILIDMMPCCINEHKIYN